MKLRTLTEQDSPVLTELLTDKLIARTYMLPNFSCREDALPLARRLMALSQDEGRFVRGMEEQGRLVGFLNDVEISGGSIELGYVVGPDCWGRGYATAALKKAIDELFRLGFTEVLCAAFEENPASLRVMEKAGMTRLEKTELLDYRGKEHLCIYYSIRVG